MIPYFLHNQRKVYVMLDACHMLKLARNCMAEFEELLSPEGVVKWSYIKHLHTLQTELTLKFKNKLSSSCIFWRQNKMKVKFAAHALSSSVANAITFLNKEGISEFTNSEATVQFIKVIDRIFDFLNLRNPFGKGYKKPIYLKDLSFLQQMMEEKINYLFCVRRKDGVLLHKTARRTFIIGFAVSIKSTVEIAKEILQQPHHKYLLTYFFSQDFLEIYFSKIRGRHGFNNNPNVIQFRSAVRQILLKNAISTSPNANCNAIDNDAIGSIFPIKWNYKKKIVDQIFDDEEEKLTELPIVPNQVVPNFTVFSEHSELKNYILHYISGYIVRKISNRIKCDSCFKNLVDEKKLEDHTYAYNSEFSKFTDNSNNGGLVSPSKDVVKVVFYTNNELLICTNNLRNVYVPNLLQLILLKVKRRFALDNNIFSQNTCDDYGERPHRLQMIVSIAHKYLQIRLFSYGKFYSQEILLPLRRRHKFTKLILFSSE
ncbi:hypothetical protein ABEB36_002972 [Hypothenemus hampei]